jgi:hypothetical protein
VLTRGRLLAVVLGAALLLSGCGARWLWEDAPPLPPVITPAPQTPEPDERTLHPYTGALVEHAGCRRADAVLLRELEDVGMVGGAVTYPLGVMVRSNAHWWAIAVATRIEDNSGYTADSVPPYEVFVSNSPSYQPDNFDPELFTWKLSGAKGGEAAAKALACVKKLPVPKPKPAPGSPESYTGRPARHAACITLTPAQLSRFQQVGRVGGAITYARGVRVKANLDWWTVAVATQVNPNSEGLTVENVAPTALFVTNSPSGRAKDAVSFPIARPDAAARKALACLA